MNTCFKSIIEKVSALDYDRRILFLDHASMSNELSDISEANGVELTFSDFDIKDSPDALYIIASDSTHESRFFSSANYFNGDAALAASDAFYHAYGERIDL